jgi:hypothetical protein
MLLSLRVERQKGDLLEPALTLLANIRLGLIDFPSTNILAYLACLSVLKIQKVL